MRKGYLLVIIFSIMTAPLHALKHRLATDGGVSLLNIQAFLAHTLFMLITILIPGLLLTRFYYNIKDSRK